MSKGSKQRPSQVSQAEYNQAWDMIFNTKKENDKERCKTLGDAIDKDIFEETIIHKAGAKLLIPTEYDVI